MKIVGLMTARNEDWVLGLTLRAAALVVDEMIVLDHASTDRTAAIIQEVAGEFAGRIHYRYRSDPVWQESSIRQGLLEEGRRLGGTHFWVIDADELPTGNLLPEIRSSLAALSAGDWLTLPWFPLWRSLDVYRRDGNAYWCANRTAYGFRDHPSIRYEARRDRPRCDVHTRTPWLPGREHELHANDPDCGAMHLVAVDWPRLVAKTAWYKMVDTVRFGDLEAEHLNALYQRDLDEADLATVPVPAAWWEPYDPWRDLVDLEAGSWFAHEVQRLWREFGPEKFRGLELWAVPHGEES